MRSIFAFCIFCLFTCLSCQVEGEHNVEIEFRKNMEVFGYLIQLGDPGDDDPDHPITKIIKQFPEDLSNPLLGEIFELGADIPYSSIVILLYHLPEFPLAEDYQIPADLLSYVGYKSEEEQTFMRTMIRKLSQFAETSNFETVWQELQPFQKTIFDQVQGHRPSVELIDKMEFFYDQQFSGYRITPSLLIWSGPGWGFQSLDGKMANFVLGPLRKNFDFTNGQAFKELAIHEYGHCFINHIVLGDNEALIESMDSLYLPLQERMRSQGYEDWENCVIEHYVRAGEIIFAELLGDLEAKDRLLNYHQEEKNFIYLSFLTEKLKDYRLTKSLTYKEAVRRSLEDWQMTYATKVEPADE